MFGFYIRNNIAIAFQCFASGLLAGFGSIFFLVLQRRACSARSPAISRSAAQSTRSSRSSSTHGSFELTAIVLSGAAGLRLGHSLLAPGRRTRRQSLVFAAREAMRHHLRRHRDADRRRGGRGVLVVGALGAAPVKYGVAGGVLVAVFAYLRVAGPPCSLIRWRCGCGRARRSKRPISAYASARASRARCTAATSLVALPVVVVALALYEIATWLPTLTLWFAKPWLDRTILFVLSRAAFGQTRRRSAICGTRSARSGGRQFLLTWTWRRLSPWRSFTQPDLSARRLCGSSQTRLRVAAVQAPDAAPRS